MIFISEEKNYLLVIPEDTKPTTIKWTDNDDLDNWSLSPEKEKSLMEN